MPRLFKRRLDRKPWFSRRARAQRARLFDDLFPLCFVPERLPALSARLAAGEDPVSAGEAEATLR